MTDFATRALFGVTARNPKAHAVITNVPEPPRHVVEINASPLEAHFFFLDGFDEWEQPVRLSIIGSDYMLIDRLAKKLHDLLRREHEHTDVRNTPDLRGRTFEIRCEQGRIARVTVELDRVEP